MRLAVVGVGNAGSRIVNRVLEVESSSGRNLSNGNTLLVNSTTPTFDTTEHVPAERRLIIGDVHWEADSSSIDGDPEVAAEVAREEKNEINRAFDLIEFHRVDGVLVVAGLAGATGGGAGAVVIDQLQAICDEPVYAVGVLPGEAEGRRRALNAARALQSFVERADNVLAFDNDDWWTDVQPDVRAAAAVDDGNTAADGEETTTSVDATGSEETVEIGEDETVEIAADGTVVDGSDGAVETGSDATTRDFSRVNVALAERLVTLFAAGEVGGGSASENHLDPSDLIRTLDTGGVSSIGYASTEVPRTDGVRAWIRALRDWLPWTADRERDDEEVTDAAKINELVRRAARSKLTLPCTVSSADRALIVLSGPPRVLSRKGFESGRYWLEREADIVDVMAGDEPHDRSTALTAVVLYSNVTDVPRIGAMQAQALEEPGTSGTDERRLDTAKSP